MATLNLDQVTKVYGERSSNPVLAVDAVDMTIEHGEIVGLLGSSGCGKTSTLRMIVGLEEISSGDINFNGKRMNE
ncbi:MAG: ATP-binding cassette domain-containing protein, partial [Pseudomonadota bacterium]